LGLISWLAGRFSRSQVVEPVEVVATPALYYQHTRIGGSLTPEDVSNILRSADTGYMWRLADLANESRQKDGHLQAILGTREMAPAGLRPLVTPASDDPQDVLIAEWVTDWLTNFGTQSPGPGEAPRDLRYLIQHLAGANYFGYAVSETLFSKDGKYVIPTGCSPLAPRRFVFDIETGRFMFWDVQGSVPYPGTDLMAEFPGRFVDFHPRINGDYESREGLCRVLVWAALFRNWSLGDWMKLAEIAWKPWRIGVYNSGRGAKEAIPAAKEDKAVLKSALERIASNGIAVIPDTVQLNVEWPKRGAGSADHEALCRFLAQEMSKATLGQTLTTEQGKVGSQALGNVHNEVRHDIRDADALAIAAAIRRDMIAPAVRLNFGANVRIPGFALVADEVVDVGQFSVAVKNLADAGLPMPAKWVRSQMAMPDPVKGDELVGGGVYGGPPANDAKPDKPGKPTQKNVARLVQRWRRRSYSIPATTPALAVPPSDPAETKAA
jgi:phage gp29-like protein